MHNRKLRYMWIESLFEKGYHQCSDKNQNVAAKNLAKVQCPGSDSIQQPATVKHSDVRARQTCLGGSECSSIE